MNLPNNIPDNAIKPWTIVRLNDGNDSHVEKSKVINEYVRFPRAFFNTSYNDYGFPGPVVITINPGEMTDKDWHEVKEGADSGEGPVPNLMFVRFRTNTWNLGIADRAISWYSQRHVPIVLTFMAYTDKNDIPEKHRKNYTYSQRTTNKYWTIKPATWEKVMNKYRFNPNVYSCGRYACIKYCDDTNGCSKCGNCAREYMATMERLELIKDKWKPSIIDTIGSNDKYIPRISPDAPDVKWTHIKRCR
jgi:hypothetical protein